MDTPWTGKASADVVAEATISDAASELIPKKGNHVSPITDEEAEEHPSDVVQKDLNDVVQEKPSDEVLEEKVEDDPEPDPRAPREVPYELGAYIMM